MEDGSLPHRLLVVSVTACVRLLHMYIKYTNAHVKESRRVFSIMCHTPWGTMLNKESYGGGNPKPDFIFHWPTIPFAEQSPRYSYLVPLPPLLPLLNPIHTFCFGSYKMGTKVKGRKAKGISPRPNITGVHQWLCLGSTLLKWNAFVVEASIA